MKPLLDYLPTVLVYTLLFLDRPYSFCGALQLAAVAEYFEFYTLNGNKMKTIDCLIISSDRVTSDTEQYYWDQLNAGWHAYYGWQWVKIKEHNYSLNHLLNYICHNSEELSDLILTSGKFDHFEIPQYNGIYLLNYLRLNGFSAEVMHNFDHDSRSFLENSGIQPKCIAISSTFHLSSLSLRNVVSYVRSLYPESVIIIGGSYINVQAKYGNERILKNIYQTVKPDYIVIESQGEQTLKTFLNALINKLPIDSVKNLFYIDRHNDIHYTDIEPENNSLDDNYIRWSEIDNKNLYKIINVQTSRSCPNQCSYCTFPQLMGKFRVKDLKVFNIELVEISKKGFIQDIIFIDDTLNTTKSRFHEICKILRKFNIGWYSFLRCKDIDHETVQLMKDSGCKGVFIGFESGDDQILKDMNKKIKADDYKRGLDLLNHHNIITFGSFILGFPGETESSLKNTYNLIDNYGLDFYAVNGWTYFTFAPIHKRKEEFCLQGKMNSWSHYSMNSVETAEHCKAFFSSIKNSVFMPSNTASGELWDVAYLMARGFTLNDVKELFMAYNKQIALNMEKKIVSKAMVDTDETRLFEDFINIFYQLKRE